MSTGTPIKRTRVRLPTGALQVHIELLGIKPKVWRRVIVPETITLQKMHLVIQRAFQWGGYHLHEFEADGQRYGVPDPDYDQPGEVLGEQVRLKTLASRCARLTYTYDFGDDWVHRIRIERVLPPMGLTAPICTGGSGATPPEDCGGVGGYEDFVRAMNDPNDPEHEHMKQWSGQDAWDRTAFDHIAVNDWLAEIKL